MIHKYSKEEDQFLIDNVKGITLKELTQRFNKKFNINLKESSIQNRKSKLKIKSGITGGQFVKGQIPFNKDKKWSEYMSKEGQNNSRKTTFKKGNIPTNTKTIGSERIDKDGYILIKIQDGNRKDNWIQKHRYIYEQEYGKIPKGYKLIFADGNKRNFNLDNLVLVSNAEQLIMNRNKLFKQDIELTKSGVVIAKLIDKVNKKKKEK